MTNKEKYKQAFSALHVSEETNLEVKKMTDTGKKKKLTQMVAGFAACVLLLGGSATAYAADVGGIQRKVQLWIHGEETEVTVDFNNDGSYGMEYLDREGNTKQQSGGGVAYGIDGSERPLTEEELLDHLNEPEVIYEEDGSVWIYYYDQEIDITDKFEDDVCYVQVSNGDETLYMTIEYEGGWSASPDKYPSPPENN